MNTESQQQIAREARNKLTRMIVKESKPDLSLLHEHDAEVSRKALCGDVELHQNTKDLVVRFAHALAEKLSAAEKKYGFTDGWADADYDELRKSLVTHLIKGDPRDVANFCAFLWHCGESTEDALSEHDAEVRKPLVDLLLECRPLLAHFAQYHDLVERLDALAKVREVNAALCCPICAHITSYPADAEVVKCGHCLRSFQLEPTKKETPDGDNNKRTETH